eukprot:1019671-Rhodomonas_salina.3
MSESGATAPVCDVMRRANRLCGPGSAVSPTSALLKAMLINSATTQYLVPANACVVRDVWH